MSGELLLLMMLRAVIARKTVCGGLIDSSQPSTDSTI
jgi:hypothetical protein